MMKRLLNLIIKATKRPFIKAMRGKHLQPIHKCNHVAKRARFHSMATNLVLPLFRLASEAVVPLQHLPAQNGSEGGDSRDGARNRR